MDLDKCTKDLKVTGALDLFISSRNHVKRIRLNSSQLLICQGGGLATTPSLSSTHK